MGLLARLLGHEPQPQHARSSSGVDDTRALERYRYMIRTAPPETIEQAHAEAFAQLTPEQRRVILAELATAAPPAERAAVQAVSPDDPRAMGRVATRTELREPGFMERTLARRGSMGTGVGGSLLGSFAMGFLGSMVAHSFFSSVGAIEPGAAANDAVSGADDFASDSGDAFGGDDFGGGDFGGGDFDI